MSHIFIYFNWYSIRIIAGHFKSTFRFPKLEIGSRLLIKCAACIQTGADCKDLKEYLVAKIVAEAGLKSSINHFQYELILVKGPILWTEYISVHHRTPCTHSFIPRGMGRFLGLGSGRKPTKQTCRENTWKLYTGPWISKIYIRSAHQLLIIIIYKMSALKYQNWFKFLIYF